MLNGTTTRSPGSMWVTSAPTSSTMPIGSWPRMSPGVRYGPSTSYRCRSEPQIAGRGDADDRVGRLPGSSGRGRSRRGRRASPARSVLARCGLLGCRSDRRARTRGPATSRTDSRRFGGRGRGQGRVDRGGRRRGRTGTTRWSSAPAPTGWSPPTCSSTPAGPSSCSRPAEQPGGAVRSAADHPAPGYTADLFSAFYPLAAASPVLGAMRLDEHGLRWVHAPPVLAHVFDDGRAAVLSRDLDETAAQRGRVRRRRRRRAGGAGSRRWREVEEPVLDALLRPFPPVRAGAVDAAPARRRPQRCDSRGSACCRPARVRPARSSAARAPRCWSPATRCTPTSAPEAAGSALYGLLLAMLGQHHGFPVPHGGAGRLTDALVVAGCAAAAASCAAAAAGDVGAARSRGRGEGVVLAAGERVRARRAVLADVPAPHLYRSTGRGGAPAGRGCATTSTGSSGTTPRSRSTGRSSAPIPWREPAARGAGTVHLGGGLDDLARFGADLATGTVPDRPFVLLGQMTTTDPTRSPAGTESVWAYAHLPRGDPLAPRWSTASRSGSRTRSSGTPPASATSSSAARVQAPADLEDADPSLDGGALNGGTAALHQQLVFRPDPRARPAGHPVPRPVPGRLVGAPGRRRARRLRGERRAGRTAARQGRPAAVRRRRHPRPALSVLTASRAVLTREAGAQPGARPAPRPAR